MSEIKFRKHYVTNGIDKARVRYSMDNRVDSRKCVTIYDKDYGRALGKVLSDNYKNDTDSMTDYFDNGQVTLFENSKYYQEARKVAETMQWGAEA